ncbi:MAG: hypothetical protein ACK4QW_02645 [Alphaproteobacteria bacterium]
MKSNRSIVGQSTGRPRGDFYPTPRLATLALLSVEQFAGTVWEPACGDGAISRVLEEHGHSVLSTDLVDRGYGTGNVDFLLDYRTRAANVVTNPPYSLGQAFVEHALGRTDAKVAMFLKLVFLEGQRRRRLFETSPLARVWVLSDRLALPREGTPYTQRGMIAFAWFVWEHGYEGPPTLGWV